MDASPISISRYIDALARVDDRGDSSHMFGSFVILVPGFMTEELYYDSDGSNYSCWFRDLVCS